MKSYLFRRFLQAIPVLIGVVTLVSLLTHMIPGDPVDLMLGDNATEADKESLRLALGLKDSVWIQMGRFWLQVFDGTWGQSLTRNETVLTLILERFPATFSLAFLGLFLGTVMAIPLGIAAARRAGRPTDAGIMLFALFGMSVPMFVKAPLFIILFSIYLGWFPVSGYGTIAHFVLPTLVLGLGIAGLLTRMVRTSILETLGEDFVRTARAKGLTERAVLYGHALRNALIPVVTVMGSMFGSLLAGAVIVETIFDWPGIGKLFYTAFLSRDIPLIQGVVLWIALTYVLINLSIDILYSFIDPRIRLHEDS